MAENFRFDNLGRIVYKITRKVGYTEEWWYKYDDKGKKILVKHIKEKKPF